MKRTIANFANAAATAMEAPTALFSNIFTAVNEVDKLRWVNIAPYGDWPNAQGMQRVTKDDAQVIVNEFNSLMHTPQRLLGAPWYIGHPDHPAFNEKYRDTKAYGRIKKLEAREDGLYAGVRFGDEGERLIADEAFHGHSVNWYLRQDKADKTVWRPFRMKSVGFTNEPNIPVPTLTTANETDANGGMRVEFAANEELRMAHYKKLATFRLFANGAPLGNQNAAGPHNGGGSADEAAIHADAAAHIKAGKSEEEFLGQAKYGKDRNIASSAWRKAAGSKMSPMERAHYAGAKFILPHLNDDQRADLHGLAMMDPTDSPEKVGKVLMRAKNKTDGSFEQLKKHLERELYNEAPSIATRLARRRLFANGAPLGNQNAAGPHDMSGKAEDELSSKADSEDSIKAHREAAEAYSRLAKRLKDANDPHSAKIYEDKANYHSGRVDIVASRFNLKRESKLIGMGAPSMKEPTPSMKEPTKAFGRDSQASALLNKSVARNPAFAENKRMGMTDNSGSISDTEPKF